MAKSGSPYSEPWAGFDEKWSEYERVAESVSVEKQNILECERKKAGVVRALTEVRKKMKPAGPHVAVGPLPAGDAKSQKDWLCCGDMFIKFQTADVDELLREDLSTLETEISRAREALKVSAEKIGGVTDVGEDMLPAFRKLKPLSKEDAQLLRR